MQETWVWSLGGEDPLEEEMATHSWKTPWTEVPGGQQSIALERVGDWARPHVACTLRSTGWIFHRMSLSEGLSDNILLITMGSSVFEKKAPEVECHFHHIISRVPTISLTCHYLTLVLILAENVFVRCLHSKITLPTPLPPSPRRLPHSWKELSTVGSYASIPWVWNICINYLEFFAQENVSLLTHLFI